MRRVEVGRDVFGMPCLVCGKRFLAEGRGCGRVVTCSEACRRIRRLELLRQTAPSPRRARDEEMRVVR